MKRKSLLSSFTIGISLIMAAGFLILGAFVLYRNVRFQMTLSDKMTANGARYAASEIDDLEPAEHQGDEATDAEIKNILSKIATEDQIEYMYMVVPDIEAGTIRYVAVVGNSENSRSLIEEFDRANGTVVDYTLEGSMLSVWNGEELTSTEDYTNYMGTFFASYALVRTDNGRGEPYAIIGAEYSKSNIIGSGLFLAALFLVVIMILIVILMIIINAYTKNNFMRPINKLFQNMGDYVSGKIDKLPENKRKRKDEIYYIDEFFHKMVVDLESSTETNNRLAAQQERAKTQMDIARRIQSGFLASSKDDTSGEYFDISARLKSARQVGGDFYEEFYMIDGRLVTIVGDVSGKGIAAALFMIFVKTTMRDCLYDTRHLQASERLKSAVTKANKIIAESNPEGMFATAFISIIDPNSDTIECVNVGHTQPVILRNGKAEFVEIEPYMALGLFDDSEYESYSVEFHKGDMIYLYTDGVSEAVDENKHFLGTERILAAIEATNGHAKDACDGMQQAIDEFVGEADQFDDITMLAIRKKSGSVILANEYSGMKSIKEQLGTLDIDEDLYRKLLLVAEEIFVNINNYSGASEVRFTLGETDSDITMVLSDNGKPFNPLETKVDKDVLDFDTGGMGIMLVEKLCKSVEYVYKDDKNILKMNINK